jgi:hypothetical protein
MTIKGGEGEEEKKKNLQSRFAGPVSFDQYPLGSRMVAKPTCYLRVQPHRPSYIEQHAGAVWVKIVVSFVQFV